MPGNEQDANHGVHVHIERNDRAWSPMGDLTRVHITPTRLDITVYEEAAEKLRAVWSIRIAYEWDVSRLSEIRQGLREVLGKRDVLRDDSGL